MLMAKIAVVHITTGIAVLFKTADFNAVGRRPRNVPDLLLPVQSPMRLGRCRVLSFVSTACLGI